MEFSQFSTAGKEAGLRSALLRLALVTGMLSAGAFALETDQDHDGVPDSRDRCPHTAQLKKLPADFRYAPAVNPERMKPAVRSYPVDEHGCEPDSDGDGVKNSRDYCPDNTEEQLVKGVAANGCPRQSDFDGTPDYRDRCPGTPKGVESDSFGCEITSTDDVQ